jgi:hypothetical protein
MLPLFCSANNVTINNLRQTYHCTSIRKINMLLHIIFNLHILIVQTSYPTVFHTSIYYTLIRLTPYFALFTILQDPYFQQLSLSCLVPPSYLDTNCFNSVPLFIILFPSSSSPVALKQSLDYIMVLYI